LKYSRQKGEFPLIMGILNVTPDSFSDGGLHFGTEQAISHGLKLLADGADILDIGGESTRPGAPEVSEDEENRRVIPVIEGILKEKPETVISIDSTKYEVAKQALQSGARIINDISGLDKDIRLAELASETGAALILMHIQGIPRTMQANPVYGNVVAEVFDKLQSKIETAGKYGVTDIIADIGIGFGKTVEHNLQLLKNIEIFYKLGVPLLLGISRKSFIGKTLGIETPSERDMASAMIHALLPGFGGDIIRVHNVAFTNTLKSAFKLLSTD
jgi:dihydropteroate synthase